MDWQQLLEPGIRDFIRAHEKDDVRDLALKKAPDESWPWKLILDQIKARQKARIKLPRWPDHHDDIIFPSPNILEQASSAPTARYKAHLVKGKTFVDLTGGAGVDSCAFTETYQSGICVEQDKDTADLITHNLPLLCRRPVQVHHSKAEDFVETMKPVDLVYLDPQRRDENKKGFYRLEDCSPNITEMLPALSKKANQVMLKTSPMLDIWEAMKTLAIVEAVHVVEWQGECKEVVYILNPAQKTDDKNIPITSAIVNDGGEIIYDFMFTKEREENTDPKYSQPQKFLFEPGPAFQKAGGFNILAHEYGVQKLHKHTHLYTSDKPCPNFPGRQFEIIDILAIEKKTLPISKANLSLRNFPGTVEGLRKKLKLSEGGEDYLFACTLADESKGLLHGRKIQKI
ncbi:MAG: hypothetical protein DHS20C02_13790 [Micavibrio sp.]|nr:MAG: hypothetical protein DHS20C02_13790 [Micavibrio sp.]